MRPQNNMQAACPGTSIGADFGLISDRLAAYSSPTGYGPFGMPEKGQPRAYFHPMPSAISERIAK